MTPTRENISVNLPQWAELLAERTAQVAIEKHAALCPAIRELPDLEKRVRKVEMGYATFLGAMVGSGLVGGLVGGGLTQLF